MKKLFKAIKDDDLETIQEILSKRPELISCTAKKPPKADELPIIFWRLEPTSISWNLLYVKINGELLSYMTQSMPL